MVSRTLTLVSPEGEQEVVIDISTPEPSGDDFTCTVSVAGGPFAIKKHAYGVDSMQAMILAMQLARAIVTSSNEFKSGNLYWLEPGLDLL